MAQSLSAALCRKPLFEGLAAETCAALLAEGKPRTLPAGHHVFRYGDPVEHVYIVTDGAVQLFRESAEGREVTAEVLIAGDMLGETDVLRPAAARLFNALAVKEARLLEFSAGWLVDAARRNPGFALNLLALLSRRAHIRALEVEHKATMTAPQQVACFFERLCALYGFDPNGFTLPYSKTLIASRLGIELETFSRALARLRPHGLDVKGARVAFVDLPRLERFTCAHCSIAGACAEHEAVKKAVAGKA